MPVDSNRRMLAGGYAARLGLREFYSMGMDSRIIAVPMTGLSDGFSTARSHEELMELRLPVFSAIYRDTDMWIVVPEASRTLKSVLRFVARDIGSYGEIFFKMGQVFGQLEQAGVGVPGAVSDRSLLESLAFTLDEDENYGGKIALIPPYELSHGRSEERVLSTVHVELEKSGYFSDIQARGLIALTHSGWEDARAQS